MELAKISGIENLTPMMKQYLEIKNQYPDTILFYRLGDFYEMFYEDAKLASQLLGITLTSRNKNSSESVPLCGVPYHSASGYIAKLVKQGHRVAICEQVEDPKTAKGIVKREVVKVLSPGLYDDLENLDSEQSNFLAAVIELPDTYWVCLVDLLAGECLLGKVLTRATLITELAKYQPREFVLLKPSEDLLHHLLLHFPAVRVQRYQEMIDNLQSLTGLSTRFIQELQQLPVEDQVADLHLKPCLLAFQYIQASGHVQLGHFAQVQLLKNQPYVYIDERSAKHLELVESTSGTSRHTSLYGVLNRTCTPMGSRLLRRWILFPLTDLHAIMDRQHAIAELLENKSYLTKFKQCNEPMGDMERLVGKIALGQPSPRDLLALRSSLQVLVQLKRFMPGWQSSLLQSYQRSIPDFASLMDRLDAALQDQVPYTLREGGIFKEHYHEELDELRNILRDGKSVIAKMEMDERQRTGISSLKIKYNRVFGYFIEVTHTHKDKIPENYFRKQSMANAERFITSELKEYENKVLGAEQRMIDLEAELFEQLKTWILPFAASLKQAAEALSCIDVLCCLAWVAHAYDYVRPELTEDTEIHLVKSRHPVLERMMPAEKFIPNDYLLQTPKETLMLITGPNMAGKSTVMRQLALCVLMAQMGSYVPAASASIGLVDAIMSRLGASDDLSAGHSTFMVEMLETSHILQHATAKSLILLDEIGRGTSTYDGLSIAWAIASYLASTLKARTMFATHYHELTELTDTHANIVNFQVAVKEWNGEIIFLRKLLKGAASRSYGIEVARLAGVPEIILKQAKEKLAALENHVQPKKQSSEQISLFETPDFHSKIVTSLQTMDLAQLTPLQALQYLDEWQQRLKHEG